ncbi:uncharacterized protein Dvar_44700 [Desulfosarcina variabilis str. Montpellier]
MISYAWKYVLKKDLLRTLKRVNGNERCLNSFIRLIKTVNIPACCTKGNGQCGFLAKQLLLVIERGFALTVMA